MKKLIVLMLISTTVLAAVTADVLFQWTAPTEREDNTPMALSEIQGYVIYCGSTPGSYTDPYPVAGGQTYEHLVQGFEEGSHYCVITTIDTDGRESVNSNMITVNVEKELARPKPPFVPVGMTIDIVASTP